MNTVRLSPAAQADLEAIWTFGATTWGDDRAALYIRQIERAVGVIAADPRRGRPCDSIRPGYLKFAVGTHLLFFRCVEDAVEIVRILHQRMDVNAHL